MVHRGHINNYNYTSEPTFVVTKQSHKWKFQSRFIISYFLHKSKLYNRYILIFTFLPQKSHFSCNKYNIAQLIFLTLNCYTYSYIAIFRLKFWPYNYLLAIFWILVFFFFKKWYYMMKLMKKFLLKMILKILCWKYQKQIRCRLGPSRLI